MEINLKIKIFIICILLILISFLLKENFLFINIDNDTNISIIVNFKNITKEKHLLFSEIIKEINSTRSYYFIRSYEHNLNENILDFIGDSVKIVQSNFPDSLFLPFVVSLYGNTIPEFVFFINGDDFINNTKIDLLNWLKNAYMNIINDDYDYIFGNSQIIGDNKIGCSLLLSKSSVIQHLLYHTNSDTTHLNPFIQLSISKQTKFIFMQFNSAIEIPSLENIFSRPLENMKCPSINDTSKPSLGIMIPAFKRNYFSTSFVAFSHQTYKPNFYVIIQNDNLVHINISLIQKFVKEPIYHIWMMNWNSFFILNFRLSSVFPCDFLLKYDDDQWPNDDQLQENLIKSIINKNVILGYSGYILKKPVCGYSPNYLKEIDEDIYDHVAVPLIFRASYLKLDARIKIFRKYGSEDVSLSLNSYRLCNVTSKKIKMNLIEKQKDGNSQSIDKQILSAIKHEKIFNFDLLKSSYCYYIHSGYIPKKWGDFHIPYNELLNISIGNKSLF